MRLRERGEGKAGLIITLIVVAYAIFCGVRFVPSYIAAYDLKDTIRRQADAAGNRTDKQILTFILEKGAEHDLPLREEHISIERAKGKIYIKVEFEIPVDLALFTWNYKFEMDESRALF